MPQLVCLVIHDTAKVDDVVAEWLKADVPGMTLLDSSGLTTQLAEAEIRDDLPLMPSLRTILRGRESRGRMIFSIVTDAFDLEELVERTERVLGSLDTQDTGIFFVVPLSRVVGLRS